MALLERRSRTLNSATGGGGGVFTVTEGTASATHSLVSTNSALDGDGGGLALHAGTANVDATQIEGNNAQSAGGVEYTGVTAPGTLTLASSTVSGNTADDPSELAGGLGVFAPAGTSALVQNSTFTGNQAHRGGALATGLDESVTLAFTTIAGNTATEGANIAAGFGTIQDQRLPGRGTARRRQLHQRQRPQRLRERWVLLRERRDLQSRTGRHRLGGRRPTRATRRQRRADHDEAPCRHKPDRRADPGCVLHAAD